MWGKPLLWLASGYAAMTVTVLVLLVARRGTQPLKFRGPWLVFVSAVGGSLWIGYLFFFLLELGDGKPVLSKRAFCEMGAWMVWVAYPLFILPYLLRSWRLHHIFQSAHLERLLEDPNYWRKLVCTEGSLLRILVALVILFAMVQVTSDALSWNLEVVGLSCGQGGVAAWLAIHAAELALLAYALIRIRDQRDDYGVMAELRVVSVTWVLALCAQFVVQVFSPESTLNRWFRAPTLGADAFEEADALIVIARNMIIFAVSVVWPVYLTYSDPFVPLWSNCDALRSLESLLRDIICIQYFRNFLAQERRVETILCWVEIELFQDLDDQDELGLQAMRIYDKYLRSGAELEVSISADAKTAVSKALRAGHADPELFNQVQLELFQTMNKDFPLFLASDSCRECLRELEKEEHIRSILENSQMI